jgi:aminopeptidase N
MYDVKYYSLDLGPNPTTKILTGSVEITCEVLSGFLDSIELNFWDGMTVSDIYLSETPDNPLNFSHYNDLLSINLDSTFLQGEEISVTVNYSGSPQNSGNHSFSFTSYNGKSMIWTLSEPYGARDWWPCKDIPSDKADSVDVRVTVPSELIVASNGSLRETITQEGTSIYWWHEDYPIATYLISLAIYPYTVYYDDYLYNNDTDTMKVHFYMFPDHVEHFRNSNAKLKDMITLFAQLFGEYPFIKEKYGMAEIINASGMAIEHQTCTSYQYAWDWNYPWWTEFALNHELAHQWWGNLVTCENFHHIWLNEGFATYSSIFWYEHSGGLAAANDYMMSTLHYLGEGTVFVENPTDFNEIFVWELTYQKAAWVMHMLRHTVADSFFFDILKTYASSPLHQYSRAATEDFQAICEQVSGINMQKFFQQWIYEEYYPYYEYSWTAHPDSNGFKIALIIDQVQNEKVAQNASLFWMPIDVKITTGSYDTVFVVWDSLESQSFEFYLNEEPQEIAVDPDNWILKQSEEVPSGIATSPNSVPEKFTLSQNYPNPFNPITNIEFRIPKAEFVTLTIYDVKGQKVMRPIGQKFNAGVHGYKFDGSNLASGIYYYQLNAGDYREVKKMILLR